MRGKKKVRCGALAVLLLAAPAFASQRATAKNVCGEGSRGAQPTPAASPGKRANDPVSGAPEVGVGRATGNVKSSNDEGGTAAGMPGRGADSGR
jgi:hypothetical protein